ncbi:pyridoxamine 5'-phosphate oxidase family protein [Selenomonadales bacterium OttesenSCG-928-I06]|nr:pyridoxamine 5'-phosphate oxidase family protein [Selenomonadales bacterium OttesenSCG-928-I06]
MKEIMDFLKGTTVQYLATIGLDGKPKVRPFQYMFEKDGKLWFCTSNKKIVYAEIKQQPYVEFSACNPDLAWLRLSGKVVFKDDMDIKNKIIEDSEFVRSIYRTGYNPEFEVFYLEEGKAVINDFSGKPSKEYTF